MPAASAPPIRVLLATHNVAGVFDDVEGSLMEWIDGLVRLVALQRSDFVALHMQEVGGTSWREPFALDCLPGVTAALEANFPAFWSSGMLMNLDVREGPSHASTFTALGSIYLVRRQTALARVSLWRWASDEGLAGEFEPLSGLDDPLQPEPGLPKRYCRHARFPTSINLDKADWSRKGHMHTRWRLDGGTEVARTLDLVNIHNFHDECNIRAIQSAADFSSDPSSEGEAPPRLSPFAECRRRVLSLVTSQLALLSEGVHPPPAAFLFGDFNTRLDLAAVVRLLCGSEGLSAACAIDPKEPPRALNTMHAGPSKGGAGPDESLDDWALVPLPVSTLLLGKKRFALSEPRLLGRHLDKLRNFDRELTAFPATLPDSAGENNSAAGAILYELPIGFVPSYVYRTAHSSGSPDSVAASSPLKARPKRASFLASPAPAPDPEVPAPASEAPAKAAAGWAAAGGAQAGGGHGAPFAPALGEGAAPWRGEAWCDDVSEKRCPAWCDRVVMDTRAHALVLASAEAAVYDSETQERIITDHNRVFLSFTCG